MKWFTIDPDSAGSGCNSCCCDSASIAPGETDKWRIDWSRWSYPYVRGLVQQPTFEIALLTPCPPFGGNQAPVNTDYAFVLPSNTQLVSTVATSASDSDGDPLVFGRLPMGGPSRGTLSLASNGAFTYTPITGFFGHDAFYFTTSDGITAPVVNRVTITVNPPAPQPALPPPPTEQLLSIPAQRVTVNTPWTDFAIVASPALKVGDIWRVSVRQNALDCDGQCFTKLHCIDVRIAKC